MRTVICPHCGKLIELTPAVNLTSICSNCLKPWDAVILTDIDDQVDAWHNGDGEMSLSEFLGMTETEYKTWLTNPSG